MTATDPDHLSRLSQVYSTATWDVYDRLDHGLDPSGPDWLHTEAARHLNPGARILDAGCRDATHLIELVSANDAAGVGVEPVPVHVDRARRAVAAAGLEESVRIVPGTVEDCAEPPGSFDFIWCRDVVEQVGALAPFLAAAARLLDRDGRMLVYTTVATDLLEPGDWRLLRNHLGNVPGNLVAENLERAFAAAGFRIAQRHDIGTEWREHAEERTRPVSRALLRLSRLRRQRERVVAEHGEEVYGHVEANLHWEVYQFLGKLLPVVYLLRLR